MVDLCSYQHLLFRPDGSFEMVRSKIAGNKLAETAAISHGFVIARQTVALRGRADQTEGFCSIYVEPAHSIASVIKAMQRHLSQPLSVLVAKRSSCRLLSSLKGLSGPVILDSHSSALAKAARLSTSEPGSRPSHRARYI